YSAWSVDAKRSESARERRDGNSGGHLRRSVTSPTHLGAAHGSSRGWVGHRGHRVRSRRIRRACGRGRGGKEVSSGTGNGKGATEVNHVPGSQPKRCSWVNVDHDLMRDYHDREWGVPTHDDRTHFEFLILEAAQAGLSWSIVLSKREGYRRAFSNFDPETVARYTPTRIDKLRADP